MAWRSLSLPKAVKLNSDCAPQPLYSHLSSQPAPATAAHGAHPDAHCFHQQLPTESELLGTALMQPLSQLPTESGLLGTEVAVSQPPARAHCQTAAPANGHVPGALSNGTAHPTAQLSLRRPGSVKMLGFQSTDGSPPPRDGAHSSSWQSPVSVNAHQSGAALPAQSRAQSRGPPRQCAGAAPPK